MNQPNRLCRDLAPAPTIPLTRANSVIAPSVGELDGHGSQPAPAREQRRVPVHLANAHNSVVAADVGVVEHDHAAGSVPADGSRRCALARGRTLHRQRTRRLGEHFLAAVVGEVQGERQLVDQRPRGRIVVQSRLNSPITDSYANTGLPHGFSR